MTVATGEQALAADILKLVFESKLKTATRTAAAASGDVAYTGIGFKPVAIIALVGTTNTINAQFSVGVADDDLGEMCIYQVGGEDRIRYKTSYLIYSENGAGSDGQIAILKTLDADGFTLTWTKEGTPGYASTLIFLCLGQSGQIV